ncbi:MAG: 2-hydroxyacyl-CoA dehydratase family protein [Promethearchaeia archaeon]
MQQKELISEYGEYLELQKQEGKTIIAFLAHDNIPEELIHAAGFIPLRMIFAGNERFMNVSHNYLPPSTCCFAQTCIGLFSLKESPYNFLELVDYIVVSNHCISDMCASEIISKYSFIPRINFYVSYTQNENGLKYYKLELEEFRKQLEEIKGSPIPDKKIIESVKKYNSLKKQLTRISQLNIQGSLKIKMYQKALLYGPTINPELERFIREQKQKEYDLKNHTKDIILTGCSVFIGDDILEIIEGNGGNIILFDSWIGTKYFKQILSQEKIQSIEDPLDLFVERYKKNTSSDHAVPDFHEEYLEDLKEKIRTQSKKREKDIGVINHIMKFCDHISLFQAFTKDELKNENIPILNLERDYSRANRGQLKTRIEAFLEMME